MNYIVVWNNGGTAEWCKKEKIDTRAKETSFKGRSAKEIKKIREIQKRNIKKISCEPPKPKHWIEVFD
ncbi:MAG: hypothetical protein ACRCZ0_12575 [Cetobacterium sp.]